MVIQTVISDRWSLLRKTDLILFDIDELYIRRHFYINIVRR